MKAVILCGGLGTRLLPLTEKIQKVMVDIGGKPLLQYHVEWLAKMGVRNIGLDLFYLPEAIKNYFGDGSRFGVRIHYIVQPKLLGTAGDVKCFEEFIGDDRFLVIYGDNIFELDLKDLVLFHENKNAVVTVTLREWENPTTKGIVEMDSDDRILRFKEKPKPEEVTTNLGNAGVYLVEPEIFSHIPSDKDCDFGRDVFPDLIAKKIPMFGYRLHGYHQDVGTFEMLEQARKDSIIYESLA